jgi:hypothetical protein
VVKRLSDIVEKSGTLCKNNVDTKLSCHNAGNIGDFNRVIEYILTVAGTVAKPSEDFDKLGMKSMHACFKGCAFSLGAEICFHFFLNFLGTLVLGS